MMASDRPGPLWSGKLAQLLVLVVVILLLVSTLAPLSHTLQAQAELTMVNSTLNALRASLRADDLQHHIKGRHDDYFMVEEPHNPFKLLDVVPANYAGEAAMSTMSTVSPGSWVFDKDCICVGYRVLNAESLRPMHEPAALWFRVGTGIGDRDLTALEAWEWQGVPIR